MWIPVKERLPERDKQVLVMVESFLRDGNRHKVCGECYYTFDKSKHEPRWFIESANTWIPKESVFAWMDLPKPYEGEVL